MKKKHFVWILLFFLSTNYLIAQKTHSSCNIAEDRVAQMNQTLSDWLNLDKTQREKVGLLNQKAVETFCYLKEKYAQPKEQPLQATLIARKKWQMSIDRDKKMMDLLNKAQKAQFIMTINESASLFYKNGIFYQRNGKDLDEFLRKSKYNTKSEEFIKVIHAL